MPGVLLRLVVVLAVVAVAAAFGRWWQRRDGRVRGGEGEFTPAQLSALGLDLGGAEAVAVLLGSPTCAPCETVKRVLAEVSGRRPDFRWVGVDAADHLDLADAHQVMRVPTLFVLSPRGRILARTSGVPAARDLEAVLDRDADLTAA